MSACKGCGAPDPHLTGDEELCGYCDAATDFRQAGLSASALWHVAGDRCADFWSRQGAYIVLKERGYEMPDFLPVAGEPMPTRSPPRLRVIQGGRP